MTQFLPPNLLALFAARDPIPYLPPVERLSHEKRTTGYTGIGDYLPLFEEGPPPPREKYETKEERLERRRREKQEQVTYKLEQEIALWDPASNEKSTSDAFKTVFIGRVNYDTTESKLKREFEAYGNIKKIAIVKDKKNGKPRGYAFVEYEHERDMHSAYKHADGKKVDGKRILVDIERGRTVKGWLPRRLGGGLGGTRRGGPDVNIKISGREDPDRERFRDEKGRDDRRDRRDRDRSKDKDRTTSVERDRRDRRRSDDRVDRVPRNPERERDRTRDRDKDKDRKRRRTRSRERNPEEEEERSRKRSRSREKKRHRDGSRSKDKKKEKKDKDRDRSERKERKMKSEKNFKEDEDGNDTQIRIKQEPIDDYPSYDDGFDYNNHENFVKQEV